MAKKQGWTKGDRAPGDNSLPVKQSRVPTPESITDRRPGAGDDLSTVIYDDYNDKPTYTGHRKGFS